MTAHVESTLARQMAGDPTVSLEVIIMATGSLDEMVAELPPDVRVEQVYRLISGIAATASAGVLRHVAQLPTVKSIEPVRTVTHC